MIQLWEELFGVAPQGFEWLPYVCVSVITLYFMLAIFNVILHILGGKN